MSKYAEWTEELEGALAEPFPAEWIKTKKAGKGERSTSISFVSWNHYVARLNALCGGGWAMGTPIVVHVGDKLVMGLPVTIFGVTRVNFGDEDDNEWEEVEVIDKQTGEVTGTEQKKTMYGSPVTNAFAQAFKRTMALFGMGLSMYDKDTAKNAQQAPAASDPLDAIAPGKKAGGKTWRQLVADEEGRGFVTWALKSFTNMAPALRTALTAAMEAPKAGPLEAVLLQDLLNQAAAVDAVTIEQAARVEDVITRGESEAMSAARDWLETQLSKKRLGAGV